MDYKNIIKYCEESNYLLSMTPVEKIVELGFHIGLKEGDKVLDFCCGYGQMLKIWSDAFAITGVGVDLSSEFIKIGNERLKDSNVLLINKDINLYEDSNKYDLVSMVGEDIFGGIKNNIKYLEKYLSSNGKILIGTPYYTDNDIPKELIEFEGKLPTLPEIYKTIRSLGYQLIYFTGGNNHEWERYISWSAKRDIFSLKNLNTIEEVQQKQDWIDKWYMTYFLQRRKYEEWGLFVISK